jgi:hypothetical protein
VVFVLGGVPFGLAHVRQAPKGAFSFNHLSNSHRRGFSDVFW